MGLHISSKIRSGILNWVVSVSCQMVSVSCRMVFVHLSIGSEAVPEGIIARISNLEMQPLWDSGKDNSILKRPLNLLAMTVGLKQKEIVDKIVEKDRQLGYCAQGDCMRNIGVVYSEYIVHLGPLGDSIGNEASDFHFYMQCNLKIMVQVQSDSPGDNRAKSSMQSYIGMQVFGKRWKDAAGRQMLD
ncbi:hypothetical protein JHK85_034816 [Glycine max]|nr:hypothetical protein JHK85_034816 [Glycine max]